MCINHKFIILSILGVSAWTLLFVPILAASHVLAASMPFTFQDNKVSGPYPIPGHELHQAVGILQQRNDSSIYTGRLT